MGDENELNCLASKHLFGRLEVGLRSQLVPDNPFVSFFNQERLNNGLDCFLFQVFTAGDLVDRDYEYLPAPPVLNHPVHSGSYAQEPDCLHGKQSGY